MHQFLQAIIGKPAAEYLNHIDKGTDLRFRLTKSLNLIRMTQCLVKTDFMHLCIIIHLSNGRCTDSTLWHIDDTLYSQIIPCVINRL